MRTPATTGRSAARAAPLAALACVRGWTGRTAARPGLVCRTAALQIDGRKQGSMKTYTCSAVPFILLVRGQAGARRVGRREAGTLV
jgi:hypothetical protein